jgi:hypothetical protein
MVIMVTEKHEKTQKKYECKLCDFNTSHKGLLNRHLTTPKHKMVINGNEKTQKNTTGNKCLCGKEYKNKSHLSRHKKDCIMSKNTETKNDDKQLIKELVVANQELTNKIVKLAEDSKTINNTINNTTNNTTNNNMTINVFLNEKCKDAINLVDFVKNMQITWEDTHQTGNMGLEESLTNLIMDKVKDMDITERPIHCTDKKRLQYYVKDGDWKNKDVDEVFDSVLYDLSKTHINNMVVYGEEHPEWIQNDDNTETYFGITTNCMIYRHEMEQRRNKIKKLLSDKVLLKKEDYTK